MDDNKVDMVAVVVQSNHEIGNVGGVELDTKEQNKREDSRFMSVRACVKIEGRIDKIHCTTNVREHPLFAATLVTSALIAS